MNIEKSELVKWRIGKANKTLAEAAILIEHKLWNTSVNSLYYACFYAVTALLYNSDLETKTHNGVERMLGSNFVNTGIINVDSGKFFSVLFHMQQNADYEYMIDYEREDVLPLLQPVHDFIAETGKLLAAA